MGKAELTNKLNDYYNIMTAIQGLDYDHIVVTLGQSEFEFNIADEMLDEVLEAMLLRFKDRIMRLEMELKKSL